MGLHDSHRPVVQRGAGHGRLLAHAGAWALPCVAAMCLLAVVSATSSVVWESHSTNSTFKPSGHTATYCPTTGSVWVVGGVTEVGVAVTANTLNARVSELDVSGDPVVTTVGALLPDSVSRRTGHVAALDPSNDVRLVIWGGFNGASYLSDMAALTVTTGAWATVTQSGPTPTARAYATLTRVCVPDTVTASPTRVPFSVNVATGAPTACGSGRSPVLVLFGGQTGSSTVTASLAVMRGNETGAWLSGAQATEGAAPVARSHHAAAAVLVAHDGGSTGGSGVVGMECIMVFGGVAGSGTTILSDLWELCPDLPPVSGLPYGWSGEWTWREVTATGATPTLRHGAAAASLAAGQMLLFGGQNDDFPNDFLRTLHVYDHYTNEWRELTTGEVVPSGRTGLTMTVLYDTATQTARVVAAGGNDRYSTLSEVYVGTHTVDACVAGEASADGTAASCTQCSAGEYSTEGSYACVQCSAGGYTSSSGQSSCTPCGAGRYSSSVGASSSSTCSLCPSGRFVASTGSDDVSDCGDCLGGTYSASDRQSCPDCAAGQRSADRAGSCTDCDRGSSSPGGQATCDLCIAGWHQPDGGMDVCFRCPAGLWSDEGATECESCPIGTYNSAPAGAGAASCVDCTAGKYASSVGTVVCTDCPAGRAHNQNRATSLSVCESCNPGFYAAADGMSGCLPCPAGKFSNSTGATTCFDCPKGTYSPDTAATSSAVCLTCPAGLSTAGTGASAASACLSCDPGNYRDNTTQTCLPCPPGTTSSSLSTIQSIDACVECAPATYAPDFGSPSCTSCASGTVSYEAWQYCTPCDYQGSCDVGPAGTMCSGHGTCAYGHCDCETGWWGSDCSSGTCATCNGMVMFSGSEVSGIEGNSVSITLLRTLGTTGEVSVDLELNSDHADTTAVNADTGNALPMSVTFADGESEKTISLPLIDDEVYGEGCEVLMLAVFPGGGGVTTLEGSEMRVLIENTNVRPYLLSQTVGTQNAKPEAANIVVGSSTYTLQVNVTVPESAETPLDMMFIEDLSGSFGDDLARLQALVANLIATVQVANADTYFGVGSFVDTPVHPFGASGEWSYRTDQQLTANSAQVQDVVDNLQIKWGNNFPESQLWALLLVARRLEEVGWRPGSRRIAVLATDAPANEASAGEAAGLTPNNGDGVFDGGDGAEAFPTRDQVKQALVEANVVPIFLATSSYVGYYNTMVSQLGFGTVVELASDSANVVEAVMAGLDAVQSAVQLVASSGSDRVNDISPTSYSDVAGQTVEFQVQFIACPSCDLDSTAEVTLTSPLYGSVAVTLTRAIRACSLATTVLTPKTVSWGGWVQRDRAGPGVTLEGLGDVHAGLPDQTRGDVPWWSGSGDVRLQAVADAGTLPTDEPLTTSLHLVNNDASTSSVAVQRLAVAFDNVLPLALRGYGMASGVTGVSDLSDFGVTLSLEYADGSSDADVAVLSFADGTHDWEFMYDLFFPSARVTGAVVSAHMRNGVRGEAWFAGIGLIVVPSAACSCDDGFYATVSKAVGVGGDVDADAIAGATRCSRCPLGFACSASSVRQCPTGRFSYGGYSSCQDCLTGRTCINGTIAPCSKGFYLSSNNTCSECPVGSACTGGLRQVCPAGFYAPLPGTEFCLPCLPGSISNSTESPSCTPCEAGTTSNFGRTACIPCGFGETSTAGQHPCTTCPAGSYAAARGSQLCEDCPVGRYSSFPASRSCEACPSPRTTTAAAGASDESECIEPALEL